MHFGNPFQSPPPPSFLGKLTILEVISIKCYFLRTISAEKKLCIIM